VWTVGVLCLAACSKPSGESATTSSSSSASSNTTAATAPAATTASIVDKALSFLNGTTPFEGELTMTMTSESKPPETLTYKVKGQKMRFDMPAGQHHGPMGGEGGWALFDVASKKITSVSDAKKTAFVIDMNDPMMTHAAAADATKPDVEKTGKTDSVAGYSCDIWKIKMKSGNTGEGCMAKGIAFPAMGPQSAWARELGDYFPLRFTETDATGKVKSKMEVTKIEKKSLDDSLFVVPAGYQTMSLDQMMKSMGAGGRMPGMPRPPH